MSRKDDLAKLGGWAAPKVDRRRPALDRGETPRDREPPRQERKAKALRPHKVGRRPQEQGAMDRAKGGPRNVHLSVTVTGSERKLLGEAAGLAGLTCSSWARRILLARAKEILT